MNKLEKISIVGGGTAGFVAALILKTRFPNKTINLIRSKRIGIIGVGEGSTEHWYEFMQYIGVNYRTVIQECDATFKCGIMFKNWGKNDYMHSIGPEGDVKNGQYCTVYGKHISEGSHNKNFNPSFSWENRVYAERMNETSESPWNQYHFNTFKLNALLEKVAILKGIEVIDDEISDIVLNESGEIDYLVGEIENYKSNFYIDCTGFARVLISKLGATWKSFSEYLKVNAAITFQTPETDEYNMWTLAQGMDAGWMFRLPVWGRYGNGYIYDSNFITKEIAHAEVEKYFGHPVEIGREFKFDPGAVDRVWIKNCCAVGLSSIFVEPLEATSIGTTIQQVFILMHRLPNYDENTIKNYNKDINDILMNIRDFVILHYLGGRDDTPFWRSLLDMKIPDSLAANLERWKKNLPIAEDFSGISAYKMFGDAHHIQILAGLELFDREKIKNEYDSMNPKIKEIAENFIRERKTFEKTQPTVGHKEFISYIRNLKKVN